MLESGARLFTGVSGPIGFPKQTGAPTVTWMAENPGTPAPQTDMTLGIAQATPKTMIGSVPFTRQLLQQASLDVEAWVRDELATGHALAIDKVAIHGKGNNGEPLGLYKTSGVFSKDFSAAIPAIDTLMEMVANIYDKNADAETMAWLTAPTMAARLRITQEFSGTTPTLWQGRIDNGTVLGYGARSTKQCSNTMTANEETGGTSVALLFGNWADLYVFLFDSLEFIVNPYTNARSAIIDVTTFQQGDIMARHGESFAKGVNNDDGY